MLLSNLIVMDEEPIVQAAIDGRSEAFAELFRHYYPIIYAYAYRLCLNQADAQDITQETFIKAARAVSGYRPDKPFQHWLYQIFTNTARDWQRRYGRQKRIEESVLERAKIDLNEGKADHAIAHELLATLPEELRAAVVLVYMEGMNHAQAAALLGCAESTVSWRIFRAKNKLKNLMTRHEQ